MQDFFNNRQSKCQRILNISGVSNNNNTKEAITLETKIYPAPIIRPVKPGDQVGMIFINDRTNYQKNKLKMIVSAIFNNFRKAKRRGRKR